MSRPTYETPEDLAREEMVARRLEQYYDVKLSKLSPKYPFDRVIEDGTKVTGFVEIKVRTNPMNQYPSYLIAAPKLFHAMQWTSLQRTPCYLAVQWADELGVHEIKPEKDYPLKIAGRTDRNDWQDIEPCFMIPLKWFSLIREEKMNRDK